MPHRLPAKRGPAIGLRASTASGGTSSRRWQTAIACFALMTGGRKWHANGNKVEPGCQLSISAAYFRRLAPRGGRTNFLHFSHQSIPRPSSHRRRSPLSALRSSSHPFRFSAFQVSGFRFQLSAYQHFSISACRHVSVSACQRVNLLAPIFLPISDFPFPNFRFQLFSFSAFQLFSISPLASTAFRARPDSALPAHWHASSCVFARETNATTPPPDPDHRPGYDFPRPGHRPPPLPRAHLARRRAWPSPTVTPRACVPCPARHRRHPVRPVRTCPGLSLRCRRRVHRCCHTRRAFLWARRRHAHAHARASSHPRAAEARPAPTRAPNPRRRPLHAQNHLTAQVPPTPNPRLSPVARQLLAYLSAHPDAQDTLEGIAEWWLLEQRISQVITEVKKGLAELVAHRLVLEAKGRDDRVHYRLDPKNRRAVDQHLRHKQAE